LPRIFWLVWSGRSAKRTELETGGGTSVGTNVPAVTANFLTPARPNRTPIGESAGLYEVPEAPGINFTQLAVTVGLALGALLIGVWVAHR
jgi:hypothetical protein